MIPDLIPLGGGDHQIDEFVAVRGDERRCNCGLHYVFSCMFRANIHFFLTVGDGSNS